MSDRSTADLALVEGDVVTVDGAGRWARALAVRDGRIVAVGTDHQVRELVGPRTEVVALGGRCVVPGFQDAHAHPPGSGVERLLCDLSDAYSRAEYARIISGYTASHPDETWILGGGWSMDVFPGGTPTKEELDALVADRPVYLPSRDGHSAWVNSRALDLAGIDRDTPDPEDGRIERTGAGEPLGTLQEGAMLLVDRLAPDWDEDLIERGILEAQRYLHSLGITAWQDAIVGGPYDFYEAYRRLAADGRLTARVVAALWWERHAGEEQVEFLLDRREQGSVGRLRCTSVKIMQDGVVENFTAGMLEPYLDAEGRPTDNRGLSFVDPEALKRHAARLDHEGFQLHFHAIGDRAVREALDAIEAARRANGMNDLRHHISHIQVIHPDDVPRFRDLGVVANGQPLWAVNEGQMVNLTIPFLGPERSRRQYPFGSLVESGAILAFGSDWSVSSPDPLWEIHVAVNRTPPPDYPYEEEAPEVFLPEERIDLPTAIRAFTMGSAYVNHLDEATGSIEVGKLADLAVLDRNPFDCPPEEIASTRVSMTYVEGERVHAADDA